MTGTAGKRAGSRRGARPARTVRPAVVWYAVAITVAVVAWGFLVYSAIDFGISARAGEESAWWFLALACVGAMACLFVALLLVARITRELGIGSGQSAPGSHSATGTVDSEALTSTAERPAVPRTGRPGGHRAQR